MVRVSARDRAHPVHRATRRPPVLGAAATQGRAAALLRWRCSSSSVTDLALIERVRGCRSAAGPHGHHGRDRGRQVAAHRRAAAREWRPCRYGAGPGGRRDRAGRGAVRPARGRRWRRREPLICVRELAAAGRTVARIDDETVPAARLAAIVEPLVAIHGQHEQQRLLVGRPAARPARRLRGHAAAARRGRGPGRGVARQPATRCARWRSTRAELERRLELADHAVGRDRAVAPRPGEVDGAARATRPCWPGRSGSIRARGADPRERLVGEGGGARDAARPGAPRGARAGARGRAARAARERLDGPRGRGRRHRGRGPRGGRRVSRRTWGRPTQLEERLGTLYGLLRKYGETEEAVLGHAAARPREVERLRGHRRGAASAGARRDERLRAAAEAAAADADARHAPGGRARLARGASRASCATSASPTPRSQVDVDAGARSMRTGADDVTFLLAPNPGEPARPLARIASGGELSRVALAIEQVLAAADDDAHARVRRGRRGHRRPIGRPGRPQPVAPGAPPPGAVRDAPAPDRGARGRAPPHRKSVRDGRTVTAHHGAGRRGARRGARGDARRCARARSAHDAARELLERAQARTGARADA